MNGRVLHKVLQLFKTMSLVCLYSFEMFRAMRTRLGMTTIRKVIDMESRNGDVK